MDDAAVAIMSPPRDRTGRCLTEEVHSVAQRSSMLASGSLVRRARTVSVVRRGPATVLAGSFAGGCKERGDRGASVVLASGARHRDPAGS